MVASELALDMIEALRARGESFCVATILRTADSTSARAGAKAVVTPDGELHGFVGGACVTGAVRKAATECMESGEPKMLRVKPAADVAAPVDADGIELHKSGCPSGGTVDIFVEPMRAARRLLVCGASPIARAMVQIGHALGYTVVSATGGKQTLPGADRTVDGFDLGCEQFGPGDAALVATQGSGDLAALRMVLGSGAGYMGMVCSRRKLAALSEALGSEDPSLSGRLVELHAPAGLNIGAIEPEEIALSVIGEMIEHRRSDVKQASS